MPSLPFSQLHDAAPAAPSRAPGGNQLRCRGWAQEAALRMLMNNLDAEVGERPQELVVYGGTGKAARNWACYHAIVAALEKLGFLVTLLLQPRSPLFLFPTRAGLPPTTWF